MSHSTFISTADSSPDSRGESLPVVAGKFLTPSVIGTVVWLAVLNILAGGTLPESSPQPLQLPATTYEWLSLAFLLSIPLSVLAAVAIYRHAPASPADWYHRLGIQLAMFVAINLVITTMAMAMWVASVNSEIYGSMFFATKDGITPLRAMAVAMLSSIFLPGPYAGAIVGRYWSN
ncbi:hypothetical protein [Haloarcula amylovorans]|uniref:hypothetical protein n=1 Tax=Haloarcula amylovorans TaxID=2562280 RepID=UPI0010766098|nr:hypothetical protein [Halomicroarcula amylolytica]